MSVRAVAALWIDGGRLNAARAAVGAPFLLALRALPPHGAAEHVAPRPAHRPGEQVVPALRGAGARCCWRRCCPGRCACVVGSALAPATPAQMAGPLAHR
jgi:hypothetical protein